MNLYLLQQYRFINNLYKNENYLDILMNIDDFFDILGIYVFDGWLDAEVVEVKFLKYFTNIVLKSSRKNPPQPKGGVTLSKYDCIVKYKETYEYVPEDENDISHTEINPNTKKRQPKMRKEDIWLIDILIPNKHIINDNIYDLESIQKKIEDEDEDEDEMAGNVVTSGDEIQ